MMKGSVPWALRALNLDTTTSPCPFTPPRSRFSAALENAPIPSGGGAHNGNVADYCWMLLLGMCTLLGLGSLVGMPILSLSLFMMVVYVWSKRHPGEQVTFYMFRMEAQYLPWCMIIFSFVVGNDIVPDLMGIAAGHLYYFLQEELPGAETVFKGWHALRTPSVLYTAWGVPPTNAAAAVVRMRQAQAGAGGPQAPVQRGHLWGQGQALGGGR